MLGKISSQRWTNRYEVFNIEYDYYWVNKSVVLGIHQKKKFFTKYKRKF